MKKFIALAILAVCSINLNAQVKLKLGWINSGELLEIMPEKKKSVQMVDSMVQAEESILKILNADYEKEKKKIETGASKMTPADLNKASENLAKIEDALYMQQQTAQEKISKSEKELINPILDKIFNAIKEVGKENGYTYILDISLQQVLVYPEGDNVLKLVKKKLGLPVID